MHAAGLLSNEEFEGARTRMLELLPEDKRAMHAVSGPGAEMQKMVDDVSSDLDAIGRATGNNFRAVVSQLLEQRHSTMLMLDAQVGPDPTPLVPLTPARVACSHAALGPPCPSAFRLAPLACPPPVETAPLACRGPAAA